MGSSIEVTIAADVSSLQAKSAVAKVELTTLNASVKSLANQFVAASADMKASLAPQLEAAAKQADVTRAHLAALNAEMHKPAEPAEATGFAALVEGFKGVGEGAESLDSKISLLSDTYQAVTELALAGLGLEAAWEGLKSTAEVGESLAQLSEKTGISTEQLSGLRVAASESGTDMDTLSTGLRNLAKNMQEGLANPTSTVAKQFQELGISLTNSAGEALPMDAVLQEIATRFGSFEDGAAKSADAGDLFGQKIGSSLIPLLNQLSNEGLPQAAQRAKDLGVSFDEAATEADERFLQSMKDAGFSVEGVRDTLSQGLIPALTVLEQAFTTSESGSSALAATETVLADSFKGVVEVTTAVVTGIDEITEAAFGLGEEIGDLINLQSALGDAMTGQWQQAVADVKSSLSSMETNFKTTMQNMQATEKVFDDTHNALWNGYTPPSAVPAPEAHPTVAAPNIAPPAKDSGSDARKAAEQQTQIAEDAANAQKQVQQAQYEQQVSLWDTAVSEKKMTKAEELQNEIQGENQIYQANLAEAQQEAQLSTLTAPQKAKALDDITVMTAQHSAQIAKLNADLVNQQIQDAKTVADAQKEAADQTAAAWQKTWQPVNQQYTTAIDNMLQGTETFKQMELKAAKEVTLAFVNSAARIAISWVESQVERLAGSVTAETGITAATTAGVTTRQAVKSAADATGRAEDVALGTAQIASSANKAAAGAFSAVAGIPYVGPVLAPAAAATAYAGVMAFDVLSASGGLDIPAGVNPLVQLHENETVLPAYIAQPLQGMIANGNVSNNSTGDTYHTSNQFNLTAGGGGTSADQILSTLDTALRSGSLQRYPSISRAMRRGK